MTAWSFVRKVGFYAFGTGMRTMKNVSWSGSHGSSVVMSVSKKE